MPRNREPLPGQMEFAFMAEGGADRRRKTRRQGEILRFIQRFTRDHGYPPTFRDVGEALGIRSPNGVMCHVRALRRKGQLTQRGTNRNSSLVPVYDPSHCPCCNQAVPV